jgi:hypothetical protein
VAHKKRRRHKLDSVSIETYGLSRRTNSKPSETSNKLRPGLSDAVASRNTQRNVIAELKDGSRPARRQGGAGVTFTASFTLSGEVDEIIHDLAIQHNVSRSAIVRIAVLRYAFDQGLLGEVE